jgi:hypothetical protein
MSSTKNGLQSSQNPLDAHLLDPIFSREWKKNSPDSSRSGSKRKLAGNPACTCLIP